MSEPSWIFGYGSLLWRVGFAYAERQPAWLTGFERLFWQGSTDHRGRPGAPGRVVTLRARPGARCAGVAYRLDAAGAGQILAGLDHRERGGYRRQEVSLQLAEGRVSGLVYLAGEENPNYLGPAPLAAIAAQVARAAGPSGSNREYLERLARELRALGAEDPHVFALEALLSSPGE